MLILLRATSVRGRSVVRPLPYSTSVGWGPSPTGDKIFRYEIMWESHNGFTSMLKQAWQGEPGATTLPDIQRKLASLSGALDVWGRRLSVVSERKSSSSR